MRLLAVPYAEKDAAKALGARWDGKSWYVPDNLNVAQFSKWIPAERVNATLFVDLVPRSAWFSNLRSELTPEEWASCKRMIFREAAMYCQACGGRGPHQPVECHERWQYDEATGIQKLVGLVALCPDCHQATHMGSARVNGLFEEAKAHLMAVNKWSSEFARRHIDLAFKDWLRRSEMSWALNATWLLTCGIELSEATRLKIELHALQLADRKIEEWQGEVILKNAPGSSALAHYSHDDY